jgi:hypothetical protein
MVKRILVPRSSADEVSAGLNGNLAGHVVLSGDLSIPIGAVLQMLHVERQTGVLEVARPAALSPDSGAPVERAGEAVADSYPLLSRSEVVITWRDGLVDLVQSRGAGDEFRLGRYFVEEGLATPAEIDALLLRHDSDPPHGAPPPPPRPLLGDILREARRLSDEQLRLALVRQASELLYELLRWQNGRFEFRRDPPSSQARRARLSLPIASVVMEGFRRMDEWRVVEATLGSFESVLWKDPLAIDAARDRLSRQERVVLDSIDGERTIRDVVAASHMSSFDVCRVLSQLLEARVVRRGLEG